MMTRCPIAPRYGRSVVTGLPSLLIVNVMWVWPPALIAPSVSSATVKPSMVLGLSASTISGAAALAASLPPIAVTFTGTTCWGEPSGTKSK